MNVILPQPNCSSQIGQKGTAARNRYPVLYLLHGWSDDESIWIRRTSIERYAASLPLVVVMPRVELSYYQNLKSGMRFWDFISEEIPSLCQSWFPISDRREDTFATGLSMGGYGAFRLGLTYPDRFAAVASLSGALDIERFNSDTEFRRHHSKKLDIIYGLDDQIGGTDSDLFHLISRLSPEDRKRLKLYQCCGTEDFLFRDNMKFRKRAESARLDHVYEEGPGSHEWGYWDLQIKNVLRWLPIR